MNQTIRKQVFETNSSSSHSLTLDQGSVVAMPFTKDQLREGSVTISLDDYGWEWHRYYSAQNKLSYLLTQILRPDHYEIPQGEPVDVTRDVCERYEDAAMLCEVVKEYTGCELLFQPGSRGSIDHDSEGNGLELFRNKETLRQFLFSEKSYIQTGNDNSGSGKRIETDSGYEDFYAEHYLEPQESWVEVRLVDKSRFGWGDVITDAGAPMSDSVNSEVFALVREQATVVKADWKVVCQWSFFNSTDHVSEGMENLVERGFKFSEALEASETFTNLESLKDVESRRHVTFTMKMPIELANKVQALMAPEPL